MSRSKPESLAIALRVYPNFTIESTDFVIPERDRRLPEAGLVFDTETRTDQTQRLTFGSYQFIVNGEWQVENLFCASDLPPKDRQILERFVSTCDAIADCAKPKLLTQNEFLKKLFDLAYRARCLLVAFNFPFDISRLAFNGTPARGRFAGGLSLDLWKYAGSRNRFRPSVCIKQIDSKRALKGFTRRQGPEEEDLIPEGSFTGQPEEDYVFRGHFLDLRTLAFALTDQSYTLARACEDFGVEHKKVTVKRHGVVTKTYIQYNRRDVLATAELAIKLLQEYEKHPIDLQSTKAYSPAAIGKAYLRAMGIPPILERQPDFQKQSLGHAQSAFFGGRTSAHIRKVAVPVVYTDFLSMYPTVNSLMGLWTFVTAREILIEFNCQSKIHDFLESLEPEQLFDPATWKNLRAFVRIIPDGDILPSRCKYNPEANDWQVALNYLHAEDDNPKNGLWFSLPDVVASVLLNKKKVPKIIDAFRIHAVGKLAELTPTKLRGMIDVDPDKDDFFRIVIEQRKELSLRNDLSDVEKTRLDKALKVLANAASYGIYAEMHRLESDKKVETTCYGIDQQPFPCRVAHPDEPGEYCFPPVASLITGAARLMLALLEHRVTKLGGTYAMEDTDSMAIVATESGDVIPCPGGRLRTKDGREAIRALSWKQVEAISEEFKRLNPYHGEAGKGSILKIEDDNRDPVTKKQRQLYCLAISAKRYALFLKDPRGEPSLLRCSCPFCGQKNEPRVTRCKKCGKAISISNKDDRWSEHGLGHLLNPTDPEGDDRDWIAQTWLAIVRRSLSLAVRKSVGFERVPAVGRTTVSSPAVMKPLEELNEGKPYADRIKPFNFLLSCHVKAYGHPLGVNAERFHLISPYETDTRKWLQRRWIDQYSGKTYRITTAQHYGDRHTARVKTYGDVLREYEYHPEAKCADAHGKICDKQTIGLLQRRHILIDRIKYIGKESNSLEEVEAGLEHSQENVYTEYPDPRRDEWEAKIVPALQQITLSELGRLSGLSRRTLIDARTGRRRPHPENQKSIISALKSVGLI